MSYTPKNNELVTILIPVEPNEKPEIAMVIRQATTEDKRRYMERLTTALGSCEELEEESIQTFLDNPSIFMCLYEDEVKLVDSEYIQGPLTEESPEEASILCVHHTGPSVNG